jgi:hypothetical protein
LVDSPNRFQAERAIRVLEDLTFRSFGDNPEEWKKWYAQDFKSES